MKPGVDPDARVDHHTVPARARSAIQALFERLRAVPPAAWAGIVIATLPLLLMAGNGAWVWDSTAHFDTNIYIGFFRHYTEFTTPFTENYKSSRLPFVLPGVALYALFPPGTAPRRSTTYVVTHADVGNIVCRLVRVVVIKESHLG
jgi:hypothetical protein